MAVVLAVAVAVAAAVVTMTMMMTMVVVVVAAAAASCLVGATRSRRSGRIVRALVPHLSLQVRIVHHVGVHDADRPDAGRR